MDEDKTKKGKVTTFKLTEDLTKALDAIAERDGCSKDAAIRRMIALGIKADIKIRALEEDAIQRAAKEEFNKQSVPRQKRS